MKITNEQIIQSARRQKQSVNNHINVEPWRSQRSNRGVAAAITIAASVVSFIIGFGVHANLSKSEVLPTAQNVQLKHDTILQTMTIRDTVYQTRIVTKIKERKVLAQSAPPSSEPSPTTEPSPNQTACSMLCDEIPYALLQTHEESY